MTLEAPCLDVGNISFVGPCVEDASAADWYAWDRAKMSRVNAQRSFSFGTAQDLRKRHGHMSEADKNFDYLTILPGSC
jgi:hypothetical protein